MSTDHLFTQALGLSAPWKVVSSTFDPSAGTLELVIDFEAGNRFPDPDTGELCPVHDTLQRTYQHLSFFSTAPRFRLRFRASSPLRERSGTPKSHGHGSTAGSRC